MVFSIIIPLYNAEHFLHECLESLIHQSFSSQYEIIIVNDGSTDGSEKIALEYANKFSPLIKYYKQSNQGAGIARNLGIKMSKGDYIMFVDADDFVSKKVLENAYTAIRNYDADIIILNMFHYDDLNDRIIRYYDSELLKHIFLNKNRTNVNESPALQKADTGSCRNIFKNSLLKTNDIDFGKGELGEDIAFRVLSYHYAKKVVLLRGSHDYFYRIHTPFNQSTTLNPNKILTIHSVYKKILKLMHYENWPLDETSYIVEKFIDNYYWFTMALNKNVRRKYYHLVHKTLKLVKFSELKYLYLNKEISKRRFVLMIYLKYTFCLIYKYKWINVVFRKLFLVLLKIRGFFK